jgi:hypothetical protein
MAREAILLDNDVLFLWERLSASMIAAGKPLPQGCKNAASLEVILVDILRL